MEKQKSKLIVAGQLVYGAVSHLPGVLWLGDRYCEFKGPSAKSARYCYSVWLRHLVCAHRANMNTNPKRIAELGPGRSLGIGLAALLSGAEEYRGLDVVSYVEDRNNAEGFEELVALFSQRADIPGEAEFPLVFPKLDSYAFPKEVLTEKRLAASLAPKRAKKLRQAVRALGQAPSKALAYWVPWHKEALLEEESGSVDVILSQAVLEHVDDLAKVYRAFSRLLKPAGFASHQIDFTSHGTAHHANGHYAYSDLTWKVIQGKRPYLLNREPHARQLELAQQNGLEVVVDGPLLGDKGIDRRELAPRFQAFSDQDLRCVGAYVIFKK